MESMQQSLIVLGVLALLAGAYSEVGRFSGAARTARRALSLALQQGNQALAATLSARISAYEAH